MIDTYSALIYTVAMAGEKTSHAIKAMKLALLVMGMPWLLVTDSGPDYSSQQFSIFLFSCRISHSFGIACNPQSQTIMLTANSSFIKVLAWNYSSESKRDSDLTLVEVLFQLNFISFNEKGLNPALNHWASEK